MDASKADRRSLSQQRGRIEVGGDRTIGAHLKRALKVPRDADARAGTQGFHPWPGRMHSHTAGTLIATTPPNGCIADPFMGGGTVIVEAMTSGRASLGSDLNPVAVEVAWARTRAWSKSTAEHFLAEARRCVRHSRDYRAANPKVPGHFFRSEGEWYDPPAIMEVWGLKTALEKVKDKDVRRMLAISLSSILVKVSRQATDSVTRIDREHQWIPKGRVESLFVRRAEEHARNLVAMAKNLPREATEPRLQRADATQPLRAEKGSIQAIISSPPYPGTYDYVEHHRRRYIALGLDSSEADAAEIGSRRSQREKGDKATQEFQQALHRAFKAWIPALAAEGRVYLVLGDGQSKSGVIPVRPILEAALAGTELTMAAWASQPRFVRGAVGRGLKAGKFEHIFALTRGT